MIALGQWDEFRLHVRAALAEGGFTPDDIKEIILQQAIYCGVPVANHAVKEASTILQSLAIGQVDAVILCTPTQMHAAQAVACLNAGKHVQVEIPLADSLRDAQEIVDLQKRSGLVAMCGHTRRFNPSHQWVPKRTLAGEFNIQQMDVQTYFFRRTNMNALGQPRSWTDHLLWHHAAHTVDLFPYQACSPIVRANAIRGPIHPTLHCHGRVNPAQDTKWRHLHVEPVVQQ